MPKANSSQGVRLSKVNLDKHGYAVRNGRWFGEDLPVYRYKLSASVAGLDLKGYVRAENKDEAKELLKTWFPHVFE